ncbi:uncharacterized protein TRIVIDRAFT_191943 [Trichoderma virens Gv29-8]|uniref:Cytochrome P450 n=1 Tax=Hypocrea virens (strain Gv29-8 / FGSC 10586) TaxID=413071 RepID=G9MUX9_HYPVG|nr:uncharacterized protein TRIVIDRAFT_191943 [Trichoderma virens Gv29-8]EHK21754.1 hypothetical protein TRIVIDRAFT_191943 [Trichoderma virens Gv29-8]
MAAIAAAANNSKQYTKIKLKETLEALSYSLKTKTHKCGKIKFYKTKDPVWGIDFMNNLSRALQENRILSWMEELWASQGTKTFRVSFMGKRVIYSRDLENMKAVSTTQFQEFLVEPVNGHLDPFLGSALSTADGKVWQHSRNLVKPYFERQAFANVQRLAPFTDRLFGLFPTDGETFDIQPLLSRWFLDATTSFLFGRSRDSLTNAENKDVMLAIFDIVRGASARRSMGPLKYVFHDAKWHESIQFAHKYLNDHIDEALDELKARNQNPEKFTTESDRTDLLWSLVQQLNDRTLLRDQLAALWIPGMESTSILVSNILFFLSRHPRVWQRLQSEVKATGEGALTYNTLRNMQYMTWVINETQRVFPAGVSMTRVAGKDTTLPRGGGPDGQQPVFCAKGDLVVCNRYLLHRDPEYWGEDAAEFRPERWDGIRPFWNFVPFGGGPRICPANVMAVTEAAYFVARFCQKYKSIESRDDRPFTPVLHAGVSNLNGVKIAVTSW